jgi:hypothetical protein
MPTKPLGTPWAGKSPETCDICRRPLTRTFVDGRTSMGPWAIMCPACRVAHGPDTLGQGRGQKYERTTPSSPWLKTGG